MLALVGAFLAGLLAPSPLKPVRLFPVLVASSDLDSLSVFSSDNTEIRMVPLDEIPDNAAASVKQVANGYIYTPIAKDSLILLDQVFFNNSSIKIPLGFKVVAVRASLASLECYLLKPGDRVSLKVGDDAVLGSTTVFAVNPGSDGEPSLVAVLVDERQDNLMKPHLGSRQFRIDLPETGG